MFTRSFLLTLIAILLIVAIIRIPFRNLSLSLGVVCLVGLQNPHQLLDEIRSLILCFGRFARLSLEVARWSLVGFAQSGKKLLHAVTCRLLFLHDSNLALSWELCSFHTYRLSGVSLALNNWSLVPY